MQLVAAIGAFIVAGYGLALWWLLRGERSQTYTALVALCGVSLALRLVLTHDYPAGLNEDEVKNLNCSIQAVGRGEIFSESCNGPPYLLSAVFAVPLVPLTGGANRWSMRSYSTVLSVLATPAAFAVARAMGLRVAAALVAGGLVAVLPWALFYGRITLGGELIFHQLLLLAALARLVWPQHIARREAAVAAATPAVAGWREALLGGFALALLLWDYYAGRAMVGMPLLAAILATGRRRLWCLAIVPLALLGWWPHLSTGPSAGGVGFSLAGAHPDLLQDPVEALLRRTQWALWTFVWPVGQDGIFTVRSVAMHPLFVLGLAAVGALTGGRRLLFLLGGFLGGLLPGVVSSMFGISMHRIMTAFVFVALAAAAAVDLPPWRRVRAGLAAVVIMAATVWSAALYFSPRFWPFESEATFNAERTGLAEAIVAEQLPSSRLISLKSLGLYTLPPPPGGVEEELSVDTWLPANNEPVIYAFTWQAAALRPQYERLFPGRVRPIGRTSFYVVLEAADWSWMRRHGWWYEARCSNDARALPVPFLYSVGTAVKNLRCVSPATHQWRAHWNGPATDMVLDFSGSLSLEAGGLAIRKEGHEQRLAFRMPADSDVTVAISIDSPVPWPLLALHESTPGGLRTPDWERFDPLPPSETSPPAAAEREGGR